MDLAVCNHLPTFRTGLAGLRDHAMRSAELAAQAGCTPERSN
jgi:hypothetical protein